MKGILFLLIAWAMMIGWIARTAIARGRNPVGWTLGAAALGAAGAAAGFQLFVDAADQEGTARLLVAAFAPIVFMFGPMSAVGFVLLREPIKVRSRKDWPVHVTGRGDATLKIAEGTLELAWTGGSLAHPVAGVKKVETDGECVRIGIGDEELTILPMGKPSSREGRIAQSRSIAVQLRQR